MKSRQPLWDPDTPVPARGDLSPLERVRISAIRPHSGRSFVHGASLLIQGSEMWCSFACNEGAENSDTETARMRRSPDGGRTWTPDEMIAGPGQGVGTSHGVFARTASGDVVTLLGTVADGMVGISTRRCTYQPQTRTWGEPEWVADGFWPLQEPLLTASGHLVLAGVWKSDHLPYLPLAAAPPAVLISTDPDLGRWRMVVPYVACDRPYWGESSVLVDGDRLLLVARSSKQVGYLLAGCSDDGGQSWSAMRVSDIPFTSSKPHIGRLSSGVPYLIGTSYAGVTGERSVLTISLGRPGSRTFGLTRVIRWADQPSEPDSAITGALSYPHAVEHEGTLHVAYSNDGGRGMNLNGLELASLDVRELTDAAAALVR